MAGGGGRVCLHPAQVAAAEAGQGVARGRREVALGATIHSDTRGSTATVYNLFLIASLLRFSLLAFRFCLVLLLLTLSSTDFFFFLGCESELCMVALAVTGLMGRSYILCSFASFCSMSSLSLKCSCCKMEQSKNIHQ